MFHVGDTKKTHHDQLRECVCNTPVGAVLESVDPKRFDEFYEFYLQDFVRTVHRCHHKNKKHTEMELRVGSSLLYNINKLKINHTYFQLVSDALDHIVHCSEFQHHSLTSMIAALHLAYGTNKTQIFWFSQLVAHTPSIMQSLVGTLPSNDCSEMVYNYYKL